MALTSTIYRFQVGLSDVDRNVYQALEFRAAMHPSESLPFFLTRILAYLLNHQEGLEFTGGISTPDEPAIRVVGPRGNVDLWIDIGSPTAKRIHKASKTGAKVLIYTHKDARMLARELKEEEVHRLGEIGLYSFDAKFLDSLGETLDRDNRWEVTRNGGELYVAAGKGSFEGPVVVHPL